MYTEERSDRDMEKGYIWTESWIVYVDRFYLHIGQSGRRHHVAYQYIHIHARCRQILLP